MLLLLLPLLLLLLLLLLVPLGRLRSKCLRGGLHVPRELRELTRVGVADIRS
jgi:hypothetical protein